MSDAEINAVKILGRMHQGSGALDLAVRAAREGGFTKRAHGHPHHGSYSVAEHCYHAVSLLILLNPEASPLLIRAVLWHDLGERWVGDLPSPCKWGDPQMAALHELLERRVVVQRLGIDPWAGLTESDQQWLKTVDLLELLLWAEEQVNYGMAHYQAWVDKINKVFQDRIRQGVVPGAAASYILHRPPFQRLSDDVQSEEA